MNGGEVVIFYFAELEEARRDVLVCVCVFCWELLGGLKG